jgi:hypothetical protein
VGPGGGSEAQIGKRGGGRFAFATASQAARAAELRQTVATFLAHSRKDIARRVVASYTDLAQPGRRREPPPGTPPPGNGGGSVPPKPNGGEPVVKVTTQGVRQTLGLAADGLEEQPHVLQPAIQPVAGVGVNAERVSPSALERLAGALADMSAVFRERQLSVGSAPHTDLAAQYAERFEQLEATTQRVEAALKALPTEPPPAPVPAPAPITVNVTAPPAPPAPPAPEIHTHVQIPENVVAVAPGAVVINQPVQPQPPAPVVKIEAPAPSPAPVVHAPVNVTILNKQKRPRSKTKVVVQPELKVAKSRKKVNRDLLGNVESIDTLPLDEPPP